MQGHMTDTASDHDPYLVGQLFFVGMMLGRLRKTMRNNEKLVNKQQSYVSVECVVGLYLMPSAVRAMARLQMTNVASRDSWL